MNETKCPCGYVYGKDFRKWPICFTGDCNDENFKKCSKIKKGLTAKGSAPPGGSPMAIS